MQGLLTLSELPVHKINELIDSAEYFKENGSRRFSIGKDKFIANLFFEPSTRTKCSFEVAERNLGFDIVNFETDMSSTKKGESLYDTVKTLESIGVNAVVIRHGVDRYYEYLKDINIPIINAGDGCGNHPTQSLLDIMTIREEFGKSLSNLTISIIGDIKHSRVAGTNIDVFKRLGANVKLVSPKIWQETGCEYINIEEAIEKSDVVMLLRNQYERHVDNSDISRDVFLKNYGLTKERAGRMKPHAIIMHPAPINRGIEIEDELVECGRSRIFKQMSNGVFVRMAVLNSFAQDGDKHEKTKK